MFFFYPLSSEIDLDKLLYYTLRVMNESYPVTIVLLQYAYVCNKGSLQNTSLFFRAFQITK